VRGTGAYQDVARAAEAAGVPWRVVRRGERWRLDGVEFLVLHPAAAPGGGAATGTPPEPNDLSVVLLVRWGEFDALLTGDGSVEVEASYLPLLGPVEVLKVGHHGSRTSTGDPLLERVRPQLSAISVGRANRFGHPAPEVLARLQRAGGRIVRTDRDGRITLRARRDGSFTVVTERAGSD
ncbi:MAG: hypothetical protein RQ751_11500, partial [Longimicrobiales bacterium]|nr:hypothetical protein [Longimicrobiales bacterium]